MSGYIGNIPVPQATQTRQSFTATASQTTFNTAGYSVGYVDVFLNGVKLAPADYTATNGSDIILAVGAASGDILEIVAYEIFQVVDQDFTGDFTVDGTTFVVDSTNNRVGIGTSSPSVPLEITHGSTSVGLYTRGSYNYQAKFESTDAEAAIVIEDSNSTTDGNRIGVITDDMTFITANSERMRIDSSGNLLVGTTDTDPYTTSTTSGISLDANGRVGASYLDSAPMILNRRSSDGTIAQFRKDGTTVGSIGSVAGVDIFVAGSRGAGQRYLLDNILPCNASGTVNDNTLDLGSSAYRYKDLYLSGGVYLGGVGAANKLDDYEEGTWTPTVTGSTGGSATLTDASGAYTKIGRMVTVTAEIDINSTNTATGTIRFSNLPFTVANLLSPTGIEAVGVVSFWSSFSTGVNSLGVGAVDGSTYMELYGLTSSTATVTSNISVSAMGNGEVRVTCTYFTT